MKIKKDIFLAILLWAIVAYAITLLTYCTMTNIYKASPESISAFGTFLSAVGAFFAAFVAAYLFTDWKDQAKYDSNKESCNMILEHISALRYNLSRKIDTINSIKSIGDFVVLKDELKVYKFEDDEKLHEFFFKIDIMQFL